jgi:hypothetical protein
MRERDSFIDQFRRMEIFLRNKRFGIDIDGTSADTPIPVVAAANNILNCDPQYKPSDIDGWTAIRNLAIRQGLSEEAASALDNKLWYSPEILNQALPVAGAGPLLYRMQQYCEFPPQFISSREPLMKQHTVRWFEQLPWVKPEQIHIRDDNEVSGLEHKANKARMLGITHFLEDSQAHAEYLLEHVDSLHVILMPYGSTVCNLSHPRLTVIQNNGYQSLWPVYKMIAKGHIPSGQY